MTGINASGFERAHASEHYTKPTNLRIQQLKGPLLVDIDMEPSPLRREDYDYGSYIVEGLRDTIISIQTDPFDVIERSTEVLLKEPPSR